MYFIIENKSYINSACMQKEEHQLRVFQKKERKKESVIKKFKLNVTLN